MKTLADSLRTRNPHDVDWPGNLGGFTFAPLRRHAQIMANVLGFHWAPSGQVAADHGPWSGPCVGCNTPYSRARITTNDNTIDVAYWCPRGCDPDELAAHGARQFDASLAYARLTHPANLTHRPFTPTELDLKPAELVNVMRWIHGLDADPAAEQATTWREWGNVYADTCRDVRRSA